MIAQTRQGDVIMASVFRLIILHSLALPERIFYGPLTTHFIQSLAIFSLVLHRILNLF